MDEADRLRAEALRLLRTIEPKSVSAQATEVWRQAMDLIGRANRLRRSSQVMTDQPTHGQLLRPKVLIHNPSLRHEMGTTRDVGRITPSVYGRTQKIFFSSCTKFLMERLRANHLSALRVSFARRVWSIVRFDATSRIVAPHNVSSRSPKARRPFDIEGSDTVRVDP